MRLRMHCGMMMMMMMLIRTNWQEELAGGIDADVDATAAGAVAGRMLDAAAVEGDCLTVGTLEGALLGL